MNINIHTHMYESLIGTHKDTYVYVYILSMAIQSYYSPPTVQHKQG
jgi:hypothetical protein